MILKNVWTYRLAKERGVSARVPVRGPSSVYAVFTYDKGPFFESRLVALDPASGEAEWEWLEPHILNEPAVDEDGTILLSTFAGEVVALDRNGRELWRSKISDRNLFRPVLVHGLLAVHEVGGGAGATHAVDRRTGAPVWLTRTGGHGSGLTFADGKLVQAVFPSTNAGELICLRAEDGALLWRRNQRHPLSYSEVVGDVIVTAGNGTLLATGLSDGKAIAELALDRDEYVFGEPLHDDGSVLFASGRGFADEYDRGAWRAVRLDEKRKLFGNRREFALQWAKDPAETSDARPIRFAVALAFLTRTGAVVLVDPSTGAELARLKPSGGKDIGGMCVSDEHLIVAHGRQVSAVSASARC